MSTGLLAPTRREPRWWERALNGFEVRAGRWFFWLNIYGIGIGEYDNVDRQFIVYRVGRRVQRG